MGEKVSGQHFTYIIAGGGAAGLSLALHLLSILPSDQAILIIDRDNKKDNDRTWCFWLTEEPPYKDVLFRTWHTIKFHGTRGFFKEYHLNGYQYHMLRGIDFYNHARSVLEADSRVNFLESTIESITEHSNQPRIQTLAGCFTADWVFDSAFHISQFNPEKRNIHLLMQHFRGWQIETQKPAFDPEAVTMFDFRTPQDNAMRFVYILPFSPTHALVEYTLFSETLLSSAEYDEGLKRYIQDHLHLTEAEFQVKEVEDGIIPMTDYPFKRKLGDHILATGTKGGIVKPSTGYAFLRIQKDSAAIARSLKEFGHPWHYYQAPHRYRFYDTTMLHVMKYHSNSMAEIFTSMFKRNRIQNIFHFLDEDGSLLSDLHILASVPVQPFIQSVIDVFLRKKY